MAAATAGPYAYGSPPSEKSSAASANVVPKTNGLGLVPVKETGAGGGWSNGLSGVGQSPGSSGYGDANGNGNERFVTTPPPPGLTLLPPVDRTVPSPTFSALADGSIPVYPSTEAVEPPGQGAENPTRF